MSRRTTTRETVKTMNTLLWTLQIVLAAVFAGAGVTKLVQSRDQLAKSLGG